MNSFSTFSTFHVRLAFASFLMSSFHPDKFFLNFITFLQQVSLAKFSLVEKAKTNQQVTNQLTLVLHDIRNEIFV